jgi:type III secretion protein I
MDISSAALSAMTIHSETVPPVSSVASMPSDIVTDRFNAMMNAEVSSMPVVMAAHSNHHVNQSNTLYEAQTLGGQILSGLQSASTDYAQKWKNVTSGLDDMAKHPSASSMLKVQSELLQVSLLYELIGKAVSRSTQNIDTLVRMS